MNVYGIDDSEKSRKDIVPVYLSRQTVDRISWNG